MTDHSPEYQRQNFVWMLHSAGVLLGYLHHTDSDFPWMNCLFEPMPEFDMFRRLFDREIESLRSKDEDWSDWHERIEALKLEFVAVNSDTPAIQEVTIIHIKDNKAWFRPIFADDDEEASEETEDE